MKKTGYIVCKDMPFYDMYGVYEVIILAKKDNRVWVEFSAKEEERRTQLRRSFLDCCRSIEETLKAYRFVEIWPLSDFFPTREAAEKEAEKRNLRLRLKNLEKRVQALEDRKRKGLFGFWR